MSDLRKSLTQSGTLYGFINTIVYIHDYNGLLNKPQINGVTLQGNKTPSDLGLVTPATEAVQSVNGKTGDVVLDDADIEHSSGVSVNSIINTMLGYIPVYGNTASGAIATFESEYALPLRNLEIEINAVQESGTPTPSSPKAISGFTGANIHVADNETPHIIDNVTAISWQSEAGTVYGGSLDVTTGVLTVTHARLDLGSLTQWNKNTSFTNTLFVANVSDKKTNNSNCICTNYTNGGIATGGTFLNNMQNNNFASDTSNGIYIRDDSKASLSGDDFKTAMSGVYLVYELATPVTYQLTPTQISAIVGTNNVFTDTNGDTTLEYYTNKTVKDAINEVNDKADTNTTAIGDLSTLTTTDKSSLVGAVNEVDGKVNVIGTIVQGRSTGGSAVFTRTWAAKASITLTKGVWIINTRVLLQQDNNGYRALNVATTSGENTPQCTSPAVNGNLTALNMSVMQRVTSESTTFYLNGVHNSTQNSELSMVSWYLNAVRIA